MKWYRVKAILLQEYFMTLRSLETLNDVFIYPIMNIIVFGFITKYFVGSTNTHMFVSLVVGMIFWQVFSTAQYTMSVATLWNMWAHNLTNLFVSPISVLEYFTAHAITAFIKAIIVMTIGSIIAYFQFGFSLLSLPPLLIVATICNLYLAGIGLGLILTGIIFAYGTRIQALTWGFTALIQPLAAVFYPITILPPIFQTIGKILPLTYMFEALRQAVEFNTITPYAAYNLLIGSCITLTHLLISVLIFQYLFSRSKETGQFAKNDA